MGDWTRSAAPANSGRVLYSLTQSLNPIVRVVVKLDGVEQDRLEGTDLRKVAGSYVQLPAARRSYQLSVEAYDANGCTDTQARPMTVVIQ